MDWIQQAISDFGDSLGMEDLALDDNGSLELVLESGELIGIVHLAEAADKEMLVYAGAPLRFDPLAQMERALQLGNARYGVLPAVQTAISNNLLVLSMRLPAREFDLPALDEAVWRLIDMQHDAADASNNL